MARQFDLIFWGDIIFSIKLGAIALSTFIFLSAFNVDAVTIYDIRFGEHPNKTRVVLDLDESIQYQAKISELGNALIVDLHNTQTDKEFSGNQSVRGVISGFNFKPMPQSGGQLTFKTHGPISIKKAFLLSPSRSGGHRLVIDLVEQPKNFEPFKVAAIEKTIKPVAPKVRANRNHH